MKIFANVKWYFHFFSFLWYFVVSWFSNIAYKRIFYLFMFIIIWVKLIFLINSCQTRHRARYARWEAWGESLRRKSEYKYPCDEGVGGRWSIYCSTQFPIDIECRLHVEPITDRQLGSHPPLAKTQLASTQIPSVSVTNHPERRDILERKLNSQVRLPSSP